MSKKIKTIEILARDFYGDTCFLDRISAQDNRTEKTPPTGYVEIYEEDENGKKKLLGKHNLVLYQGREWVAQKLVNKNNSGLITNLSTKEDFLSWFGLGTGGVIPGDPFNPSPPTLTDTELSELTMIIAIDSSAADYHLESEGGIYADKGDGNYKIPFDSVEFEQDVLNDDKWLVMKIITTVAANFANGNQLSEAGLYVSSSTTGGYSGDFTLFSRVTFPSLVKTSDRRLIFSWFLYV